MCGRFTLRTPTPVLIERFQLDSAPPLSPRFNIAPTQPIAVVRMDPEKRTRTAAILRWGLVPPWSKDPSRGPLLINARAETVAEKPAFRKAFQSRRCLIPADGFYEWKKTGTGKQPYHLRLQDEDVFAFAGLWESWRDRNDPSAEPLHSCTILTTEANELVRSIHNRMPVILKPEDYDRWLDVETHDADALGSLLVPFDADRMVAVPVSTYVNNARHDDPRCLDAADTDAGFHDSADSHGV